MTGRLQREIQQTRPFSSVEEEVVLNVERTSDALQRAFAELLKPSGLSGTQYNVLRILRGAGAAGLRCQEIGNRMITHDPDITRLLDRLERRGLIARRREEKDRRVVTTRITAGGLKVLKELDEPVRKIHRQLLGHMDSQQLAALNNLLERARAKSG